MQKSLLYVFPPQAAPSMPSSHSYTIVRRDPPDDDDSDICPVCDGECTCRQPPTPSPLSRQKLPGVPLSMAELSIKYATEASFSPSSARTIHPPLHTHTNHHTTSNPAPPKPTLKIKLTVPPGMLAKQRLTPIPKKSRVSGETTSDYAIDGYHGPDPTRPTPSTSTTPTTTNAPGSASTSTTHLIPKKRGRPPKSLVPARALASAASILPPPYKPLNPKSAAPGKHAKKPSFTSLNKDRVRQNLKARTVISKKAVGKKAIKGKGRMRRKDVTSDEDENGDPSEQMMDARVVYATDMERDRDGVQFPTFVSASALSSMCSSSNASSSSSEDSSLTDFDDSDSSIEAEEEKYIVSSVKQEKARIKRELLGGDEQKRRGKNNDWVIRPRKRSVGLSGTEMDVDSDATEEDDDDDEEEDEDDGEADVEADVMVGAGVGMGVGMSIEDNEDDEETDGPGPKRGYVGLATGWSEDDDESSCDADLFFANLSGSCSSSDSDTDSACAGRRRLARSFSTPGGEDGDQSDMSSSFISTTDVDGRTHTRRRTLENLPFEITEGWDGQIIFTNGVEENHGIVDLEFENDTSGLYLSEDSTGSDVEMAADMGVPWSGIEGADAFAHAHALHAEGEEVDDGGYEEEDGGEAAEGDTTDEELVGEDNRPNERAMELFSFPMPMSLETIDPLSTVSPCVSPSRERRRRALGLARRTLSVGVHASDILAGKAMFWDSAEEMADGDEGEAAEWDSDDSYERLHKHRLGEAATTLLPTLDVKMRARRARSMSMPRGPRTGVFLPSQEMRQAIIGEEKKGSDVPSPHPRFTGRGRGRGRGHEHGHNRGYSTVKHLLHKHLLQSFIHSSAADPSVVSQPNGTAASGSIGESSLHLLLSSAVPGSSIDTGEESGVPTTATSCDGPSAEAELIDLDDVLEASFLHDPAPAIHPPMLLPSSPNADGDISTPTNGTASVTPAATTTTTNEEAAAAKNLSRWDLISVGAFRQTRETNWEARNLHTHGSSADYDNAMRSSPLSAMLWQTGGGQPPSSKGSNANAVPRSKGAKDKLTKRRRIMMSSSTMSSPLILPFTGGSGEKTPSAVSTPGSLKHSRSSHHVQTPETATSNKTRKELRRERKLKKKAYGPVAGSHHSHQQHGSNHNGHANFLLPAQQQHQYHSHHHHPNAKTRSSGATQRTNFFAAGVPPLNL